MITIFLLTNENIEFDTLHEIIKNNFPNCSDNTFKGSNRKLFVDFGKWPNDFRITLRDTKFKEDDEDMSALFYEKAKIDNPSYLILELHQFDIASNIVKVLYQFYPELAVLIDDYDWVGTAKEYIETPIETIAGNRRNF